MAIYEAGSGLSQDTRSMHLYHKVPSLQTCENQISVVCKPPQSVVFCYDSVNGLTQQAHFRCMQSTLCIILTSQVTLYYLSHCTICHIVCLFHFTTVPYMQTQTHTVSYQSGKMFPCYPSFNSHNLGFQSITKTLAFPTQLLTCL